MTVIDIEKAIEELKAEVRTNVPDASGQPAPEIRAIINAFELIRTELHLDRPNVDTLFALLAEAKAHQDAVTRKMIDGLRSGWVPTPFGTAEGPAKITQAFDALGKEIVEIANRRTTEFHEASKAAELDADARVSTPNEAAAPNDVSDDRSDDITDAVVAVTERLNEVMSAHPESKSDFLPILEQLVSISMRAIGQRARSSGAPPPPQAPVDGADSDNYDRNTHEMRQEDMTDLTRQEVDAKLAASEAKVDARLANFDTSIKTGFAELRAEMADMRADAHKSTADIIKWGIVTALGFATATVTILTFMINNAGPKLPAAQQAPIVITVPGAAVAPAAPPSLKNDPVAPQ